MKEIIVFVDDDCRSCEKIVEKMRRLAQEDGAVNLRVVHRREQPSLAAEYRVQIVPAVYVNGKLRFYGEVTREEIQHSFKQSYSQKRGGSL
jgi:thioredoxin-like negative regulator of GroEL